MAEHGGGHGHEASHGSHGEHGGHGGGDEIINWQEVAEFTSPISLMEAVTEVADEVGAGQSAAQGIVEASATAMLGDAAEISGGGHGGSHGGGHGGGHGH